MQDLKMSDVVEFDSDRIPLATYDKGKRITRTAILSLVAHENASKQMWKTGCGEADFLQLTYKLVDVRA